MDLFQIETPDLILYDTTLPNSKELAFFTGLQTHSRLAQVPVVCLTEPASEAECSAGLQRGKGDCIVKPFFVRDLIALVRRQIRQRAQSVRELKCGEVTLDPLRSQVISNGSAHSLTATELRLLQCLVARPGVVFTRKQLLYEVWGHDQVLTDRLVDAFILRLRKKIEPDPTNPVIIRCVRGFGYCFNERAGDSARA